MNDHETIIGKTALVTGGATRIGRALCLTLAKAGAAVAIHYRNSDVEARNLQLEIGRLGGRSETFQAELNTEAACRTLISEVSAWNGAPYLLVNNASLFTRETLAEITEASLLQEFWPNLFAPMLLSRYFAEKVTESGVIIHMLDRRITANDTRFFAYGIAKKALADLTTMSAVALAPRIKVHGIAPGPILPPPGQDEHYLKEKGGRRLLDDPLDPSAIATAMMALLSLRGATGQIIYIDAGQHLLGNGV
jgi:pteridine reductase